jgi:ribosomal protein S18 acetylase RimI-like enzyme
MSDALDDAAGDETPRDRSELSALRIVEANLDRPAHQAAVLELTRSYAREPIGNDGDLPAEVQRVLVERLRAHPTTIIMLAFDDERPIGIATCFLGFSTFAGRRLMNIHDVHVIRPAQRRGVGWRLLEAVEAKARELECCKLTLEVYEDNAAARALYRKFGFVSDPGREHERMNLFQQKPL